MSFNPFNFKQKWDELHDTPISKAIIVAIIGAHFMLSPGTTEQQMKLCEKNFVNSFFRNFVHGNFTHLLVNVYALFALSRIERQYGSQAFVKLVLLITVLMTVLDFSLVSVIPDLACSIGFSGILFGLIAFEVMEKHKLSWYSILFLIYSVLYPSIKNKRASLVGHATGALAGGIASYLL